MSNRPAPFSVGGSEAALKPRGAFFEKCREIANSFNDEGRLLASIMTKSDPWGRIWRADYEHKDENGKVIILRIVCWSPSNFESENDLIIQEKILEENEKEISEMTSSL